MNSEKIMEIVIGWILGLGFAIYGGLIVFKTVFDWVVERQKRKAETLKRRRTQPPPSNCGLIASLKGPAGPTNWSRGTLRICVVLASLWSLLVVGCFISHLDDKNSASFLAFIVIVALGWVVIFGVWLVGWWIACGFASQGNNEATAKPTSAPHNH